MHFLQMMKQVFDTAVGVVEAGPDDPSVHIRFSNDAAIDTVCGCGQSPAAQGGWMLTL